MNDRPAIPPEAERRKVSVRRTRPRSAVAGFGPDPGALVGFPEPGRGPEAFLARPWNPAERSKGESQ